MRLGVIHATNNAIEPLNKIICKNQDIKLINFLNEYIQEYSNEKHVVKSVILNEFLVLIKAAERARVDKIIVACSVLTPEVDKVQNFTNIPIIPIDYYMINKAVRKYNKIGVIATNGSTIPSITQQIELESISQNKNIECLVELNTKAMDYLKKGNFEKHDELNLSSAMQLLTKEVDVILLAQVTQVSALKLIEENGINVMSSPIEFLKKI